MKIVQPSFAIIPEQEQPLKKIEYIARTCYKSEDKITRDSYLSLIKMLVERRHYAMLEHASIILSMDDECYDDTWARVAELEQYYAIKCFLNFTSDGHGRNYVSGSIRAWIEFLHACTLSTYGAPETIFRALRNSLCDRIIWKLALPELEEGAYEKGHASSVGADTMTKTAEILTHRTLSVRFVTDRGVSHELVRHRPCSFAQESTRYCNYAQDKFGNELTFIEPPFLGDETSRPYIDWRTACCTSEEMYLSMLDRGCAPQEARAVLPNSIKTEIIMTANFREWAHIFALRALDRTGPAHPQMKQIMVPLYEFVCERDAIFKDL